MDVPINIEEPDILRAYLNELNNALNGIVIVSKSLSGATDYSVKTEGLAANKEFLKFVEDTTKLSNEIKKLVEDNIVTITKTKALATAVTEQFGSFSESALAASWYGLSVTAGGTVAGYTVGAIDTDTTTPGTESSFFAIEADRFTVGKAHNLTPEEAQAVAESNEDYLTLYDSNGDAVPAFGINYDSASNKYKIYFNGSVSFTNLSEVPQFVLDTQFTNWLQDSYSTLEGSVDQNTIDIASITTNVSDQALLIANIDSKIDTKEQELITSILAEEQARIAAINTRIEAEALLDGKIDDEEQARLDAIAAIDLAYKEYTRVVTLAIADGILTPEEEALIASASAAVEAAKLRFSTLETNISILQAQTDGKIEYYFILSTDTDPANAWTTDALKLAHHGDIKYLKDTKVGYSYNSTSGWVLLTNTALLESVQVASEAKATADGKITTYYGLEANRTTITGEYGDLYICSDTKKQYIWNTSWVLVDTAIAINNSTTTVDGGKITSNSITVDQIDTTSITLNSLTGSISFNDLTEQPSIPSNISDLTNDSGFITSGYSGFTYIDANGVYTGNLTANTISAPLIDTGATGYIRGGKTSYTDTTAGYFMGYYNNNYVFKMGNATKNIAWDGTNLTVTGQVIALGNLPTINNVVRHNPSNFTLSTANTWYTIAQVTISVLAGQYVDINCDFLSNKGNNIATPSIRVIRGSTFIFGSTAIGDANNSLYANNLAQANSMSANSFTFSNVPGAGTHTYYLQVGTHNISTVSPRIDPTFTQIFMKAQVFNI